MAVPVMADMKTRSLAVIGCGNPARRDDGAGPAVIERLQRRPLADGVLLFDAGTDGMGVLYRARGAAGLIIVDARKPAGTPGAVFDVPGVRVERTPPTSATLHDFRWDHALYAGRRIAGAAFPRDVRVFLIEAADLGFGLGLSAEVDRAVDIVVDRITGLAAAFAARVRFAAGSIHLPAALAERHFADACGVIVLVRQGDVLMMPVRRVETGGYLLKRRNAAGDRVAVISDVLADHGLEALEGEFGCGWDEAQGALVVPVVMTCREDEEVELAPTAIRDVERA